MAQRPARFPPDRFDLAPADLARVGAHRAPAKRHRGFVAFAWAALATGALVGVGVLGLQTIESTVAGPTATTSGSATASGPAPTIDPGAQVVMLNATTTSGLAASASKVAKDAGWNDVSTANADTQDITASTVYYGDAAQLGAARGLAKSLGIRKAPVQSDRFSVAGRTRLTVVLGSDYTRSD